MFKNKYLLLILIVFIFMLAMKSCNKGGTKTSDKIIEEINPYIGEIKLTVATTGVIEPQNRLEIKPSINGRVEEILVREGDKVEKGDILAYMSSTERAALVDAASSKGDNTRQYWEEVYKQTPVISPIDGEVIVRPVEPGQTITTSDVILVLSDRLIVNAQFDETDIGRVRLNQNALIALDAYPDEKIEGTVDHIAYESKLINNVNIYDVDILPKRIPEFFRSGMSANVEVIEKEKKDILLIPVDAIIKEQGKTYVAVKTNRKNNAENREVKTGISDEKNIEIILGITITDVIITQNQIYSLQKKQIGTNPFTPFRGKKK